MYVYIYTYNLYIYEGSFTNGQDCFADIQGPSADGYSGFVIR